MPTEAYRGGSSSPYVILGGLVEPVDVTELETAIEDSALAQIVGEDLLEATPMPGSLSYVIVGGLVLPVDITEPEAEGGSTEEHDPSVSSSEEFRSG